MDEKTWNQDQKPGKHYMMIIKEEINTSVPVLELHSDDEEKVKPLPIQKIWAEPDDESDVINEAMNKQF